VTGSHDSGSGRCEPEVNVGENLRRNFYEDFNDGRNPVARLRSIKKQWSFRRSTPGDEEAEIEMGVVKPSTPK
jgi:hypothetical protein